MMGLRTAEDLRVPNKLLAEEVGVQAGPTEQLIQLLPPLLLADPRRLSRRGRLLVQVGHTGLDARVSRDGKLWWLRNS